MGYNGAKWEGWEVAMLPLAVFADGHIHAALEGQLPMVPPTAPFGTPLHDQHSLNTTLLCQRYGCIIPPWSYHAHLLQPKVSLVWLHQSVNIVMLTAFTECTIASQYAVMLTIT